MSRERFERLFPVPEWVSFDGADSVYYYAGRSFDDPSCTSSREELAEQVNAQWKVFKSRQPEIDELVRFARRASAYMYDLRHLAEAEYDEHEMQALLQDMRDGDALIAKHKGGA